MRSLCIDKTQQAHLAKLIMLIRTKVLTGTQAWAAFSLPKSSKTFDLSDGTTQIFKFSLAERKTYVAIRNAAQKKLFEQYGRTCSYCRRPVGHYGYSWHIEHVLPKSLYPSFTFKLANLTVGCVDCNRWKGARVDQHIKKKFLPIINPIAPNFKYSDHLRYFQIGTEDLNFVKYLTKSTSGARTFELLNFEELERAQAIDCVEPVTAALHERFTQAMAAGLDIPDTSELLDLLGDLKSAIYRRP